MPVVSLRLEEKDLRLLREFARKEDKDRSAAVRELLNHGFRFKQLLRYKKGQCSLGRLSGDMGSTVSETLDFLAELGLPAPLEHSDYLQGFTSLAKLGRRR